ncbi:MAG: radical SAM protein [Pseudomonadota bacterium]
MSNTEKGWRTQPYRGFEQGPIRPPSEAGSLLIRVTRNCPWNHCTFCPVYKRQQFSLRPSDHVIEDIDRAADYLDALSARADGARRLSREALADAYESVPHKDETAFYAVLHWYGNGAAAIFFQDANSLIMPPNELVTILRHIQARFPGIQRITSYARSRTVARISAALLAAMRAAGLSRIHVGMESGSDAVLKMVKKGSTQAIHVSAGRKIKTAGMELSEYVMPGLGGRALSREHAIETAEALNHIDPDFIRLRTLAVPAGIPLHEDLLSGVFTKCGDLEMAEEIRLFISRLSGITSRIHSDHILNLFEEIDGQLPEDQPAMLQLLDHFLELPSEEQMLFQVGRRLGILRRVSDMGDSSRRAQVADICHRSGITPENMGAVIDRITTQFI